MNKIIITKDEMFKIAEFIAEDKEANWIPVVGVYLENYGFMLNKFNLYVGENWLFKVEVDKEVIYVNRIDLTIRKSNKYVFSWIEFVRAYVQNVEAAGKTRRERDKYAIEHHDDLYYGVLMVMEMIIYVVMKSLDEKVEEPLSETSVRFKDTKEKKQYVRNNTDKVFSLTQCIRRYARHVNHCKHTIRCEHWEVKGHFRHYKSGKVVYVKPFEKGANRNAPLKDKVFKI